MKKTMLIAAALVLGTAAVANAGGYKGSASTLSPGQQMQNQPTGSNRGASQYSPGDRMQDKGTVGMSRGSSKGASQYAPGTQQKKY